MYFSFHGRHCSFPFFYDTEINIGIQRDDRAQDLRGQGITAVSWMPKAGAETGETTRNICYFITESDVIGLGEPIYPIEKYISVNEKCISVNDGAYNQNAF